MNSSNLRMGKITNINDLKAAITIDNFLPLIGIPDSNALHKGNETRVPCVLHGGDHGKNLCLDADDKIAHCFVCHFKGDWIKLYQEANRIGNFREAAQALANAIGFTLQYEGAIRTKMPNDDATAVEMQPATRSPQQVLDESEPLISHSYTTKKCVDICKGLYIGIDSLHNSSVIVPLRDVNGKLQTVQFVHERLKPFLSGHPTKGAFFVIDEAVIKDGDMVYLAEGLATALTIWMACDKSVPVISFGSSGNLVDTAKELAIAYPNIKLRICLDYNAAAFNQAYKLQDMLNCSYCWPSFEGLADQKTGVAEKGLADFNDIVSKCGDNISTVKSQLAVIYDYAAMAKELAALNSRTKDKAQATNKVSEAPFDTKMDNDKSNAFEDAIEAECIKHLIRPFNGVVADGSDLLIEYEHFTGLNRVIVEAIFNTYADENKPVTIQEIALHAPEEKRPAVYERLEYISTLPLITHDQFKERASLLSKISAKHQLEAACQKALSSSDNIHITSQNLRQELDHIQGKSVNISNQKQKLEKLLEKLNDPKSIPIATGFKSFDRLLGGGIRKGELIVLTAGAGGGKSAFALNLADNLAQSGNVYCIYISVEVSEELLTDRTLKRLTYEPLKEKGNVILSAQEWRRNGAKSYERFCENICIERGRDGMTVSEIRAKVLSIMRRTPKNIFLIIDPFQRLDTGNEKIDLNNETIKTGKIISDIKKMATELNIPIMAISDTTKGHKENTSGDGAGRNSYMIDHVADVMLMLRTSRDAKIALIGSQKQESEQESIIEEAISKKIVASDQNKKSMCVNGHELEGPSDVYAALVCPKTRNSARINPLFIYHKSFHSFEDIELYEGLNLKE